MQRIFSFILTLVKNTTKTLVKQDKTAGVAALYFTCLEHLAQCETNITSIGLCQIVQGIFNVTQIGLFALCHIEEGMCDVTQIEFCLLCVTSCKVCGM